jgi:molybdenum cofactor biosynthesis enzyme MoaA
MFDFIRNNMQWIFSGIGVAIIMIILKAIVKTLVKLHKRRLRILRSSNEYLNSIYKLYSSAKDTDVVCTCTSSWPLNPARINILEQLRASSVIFLGPIKPGSTFLGVLWRFGISEMRNDAKFRFMHREVPGLKFVVVGSNVVISDSSDEKPSRGGAVWMEHEELARLLRNRFNEASREGVSLEDRVALLIRERVQATPKKSVSVLELLHYLTQGTENIPYATTFTETQRLKYLKYLLQKSLPRKDLIYRSKADGDDRVLLAPRSPDAPNDFTLPAIRICDTLECNLRCIYCPQYGENFPSSKAVLPFSVTSKFIGIARDYGFTHFRFTGGEPLRQYQDIFRCIDEQLSDSNIKSISIATNGVYLTECIEQIAQHQNVRLKVSLDTLNQNRFYTLARVNSNTFQKILRGLELVRNKCIVGINTVVTNLNVDDISSLIDYCKIGGFYLKLMDLNWYEDQQPPEFYTTHYVSLGSIINTINTQYPNKRHHKTVGGYGIPMTDYVLNNQTFVRIKDHTIGSTYAPLCVDSCRFYPCQEGLYQLTFTADGRLRACRHRPDLAVDISDALHHNEYDAVKTALDNIIDKFYRGAFFFSREQVAFRPLR